MSSNNFVISLKSATTRRKHIDDVFTDNGVEYTFFNAIEPTPNFIDKFNLKLDLRSSLLEETEIACLLSHFSLWQHAIKQDMDFISIFEDDIHLGKNANFFLNNYKWIPNNVHLIKLEAFKTYRPMKRKKINLSHNRKLAILKERHLGSAGYILSKSLAKDLVNYVQNQRRLPPLDYLLFDPYFIQQLKNHYHIYQLQPALCVQDMNMERFDGKFRTKQKVNIFTSQVAHNKKINKSANKKLYDEKRTFIVKIKQELHKLLFRNQDKITWQ